MAQFYESSLESFNALAFAPPSTSTISYLEQLVSRPTQTLSDLSQQIMNQAVTTFENTYGSDAMRIARAAARQIGALWDENNIRALTTLAQLQTAPLKMLPYLMAETTTRRMYQEQRCDGYSGEYVDAFPGTIGESHYHYRKVMNGIIEDTDDGWTSTQYFDDHDEWGEEDLTFEEQHDILRSWASLAKAMMQKEDDPTSRWNASL
jgi:hypothetical protein